MKKDYLALIRLDDFDKLFKYGRLQIGQDHVVLVPGLFKDVRNMSFLFEQLVNGVCDFQLPFEYVILHYQKEASDLNLVLRIVEVKGLYPLNDEAKRRVAPRLDSRVYINEPLWPSQMQSLIENRHLEESHRGIDNIWQIFKLTKKDYCAKVIDDNIIKVAIDNAYSGKTLSGRPLNEQTLWLYLMRYRRYSMFPKNAASFILDAAFVEFLYEEKGDEDAASMKIDQSPLCNDIRNQKGMSLTELMEYVDKQHPKFGEYTDSIAKDYHIVAPIYCMFIETVGDKVLDLTTSVNGAHLNDIVKELKKHYPQAVNVALYMLGAVLGYEKTYDALYQKENLALFKKDEADSFRDQKAKKGRNNGASKKDKVKGNTLDFGSTQMDDKKVVESKISENNPAADSDIK